MMEENTTTFEVAQDLLCALNDRDIEKAYELRNQLLHDSDLKAWNQLSRKEMAVILYALGQILSRDCCFQTWPLNSCQIERLDDFLGIRYSGDTATRLELQGLEIETTAYLTFYCGVSALHRRTHKLAHEHFADTLRDAQRLGDLDLQANAHFFLSTCYLKLGQARDQSERHLKEAREALEKLGASEKRVLVVEIHWAWERFAEGDFETARAIAFRTINRFGTDYATRAHAFALLARIQRREGNISTALQLIQSAVTDFQRRDRYHRALARAYANVAHTEILLAQREKSSEKRETLLEDASKQLAEADIVYQHRHYDRQSRPEVDNLRATIEYSKDSFKTAFTMAERAYSDAKSLGDYIEMSTARITQCMCLMHQSPQVSRSDKETTAKIREITEAHRLAQEAVEAVEELGKGKHPRRLARANIWLGRVLLHKPFADLDRATECFRRAKDLLPLSKNAAGYIGEELEELGRELERAIKIEEMGQSKNAVILTVKFVDVLNRKWRETKSMLEDRIISALVGSMTDREIRAATEIHRDDLYKIKLRCKERGLIAENQLQKRKGRKKKT